MTSKSCEKFHYGGCFGNGNNFETKNDCKNKCGNGKGATVVVNTPKPVETETHSKNFLFSLSLSSACVYSELIAVNGDLTMALFFNYFWLLSMGISCKSYFSIQYFTNTLA
jgi:hypothetical protein